MTISRAEYATLGHVTPTGLAEATYQRGKRHPAVGPSGLPVPAATSAYRVTADPPILAKMVTTALGEFARRALPIEDREAVALVLIDDVLRRYPLSDMVVLERYGHAKKTETLIVDIDPSKLFRVALPWPITTTGHAHRFNASSRENGAVARIPVAAEAFFARASEVEQTSVEMRAFGTGVTSWPLSFRREHGRLPTWTEIGDAWPVLGSWLRAERARMAAMAKVAPAEVPY